MKTSNNIPALVAAGLATLDDMEALGAEAVRLVKANPDVLQIRAKAQEPISINEEKRTISYLASDETVDRMGDIIQVKGWDLKSFKRNPVVLWAHDGKTVPPIGKASNVRRRYSPTARLTADIEFAPPEAHEFADTIYQLASRGFIRATSVGFLPKETEEVDEAMRKKLGLGPYGSLYTKSELMEISVVAVPANPSALENGVKTLSQEGLMSTDTVVRFFNTYPPNAEMALEKIRAACRSFVDFGAANQLADGIAPPAEEFEPEGKSAQVEEVLEERMAKPPHKTPMAPVEQDWDAAKVWRTINDEYEGKAKAERYWDIAAYMVPDTDPETQGAYKFPHHDADGKVVWRGVTAAMAALNGARGGATGLTEEDRKGVWKHLAAHYAQFETEPPELRALEDLREDDLVENLEGKIALLEEENDRLEGARLDERLVEVCSSLVEHQAEQIRATRQLVDALSDLVRSINISPGGVQGNGLVHEPEIATPDAERMMSEDEINGLLEGRLRGFAQGLRRDLLSRNPI